MIPQATVSKILEAADIVDVVSDFVTLKRAGANLKGLCPFHDDRTPSFMVSPARNYCKCFACGKGGSPVGFIMEHEQMTYPEALRYLARKYGIPVEEEQLQPGDRERRDDRESMFIVNEWARDWFMRQMNETTDGRAIGLAYFRGRGFRDDIIQKFQVGFCPDSREVSLSADALKAGYAEKYLVNTVDEQEISHSTGTGLSLKREDGSLRDRFRGRVMWPIFSTNGRIAGFGGRVLDAATKGVNVKYLNSPESIIYSKRRELFGYQQGKNAIAKQKLCFVVEGYTDVMAMHQSGIENVVAASGTAFTEEQGRIIKRLTDNVVLIFDGDAAGIKASNESLKKLLPMGMNVKLLSLPDDDDPDSFSRKHTPEEFQEYLATHQVDFVSFKINLHRAEAEADVAKMVALSHEISATIALVPDEITRSLYIRKAASQLNIKEEELQHAVLNERRRMHEEREKEKQRQQLREAHAMTPPEEQGPQEQTPLITPPAPLTPVRSNKRAEQERALAEIMLRYGEQVLFTMDNPDPDAREEDAEIDLTVLEFINLSLAEDELTFVNRIYQRMMDEGLQLVSQAKERLKEQLRGVNPEEATKDLGFSMLTHFLHHPEYELNMLASELSVEQEPLSRYHGTSEAYRQLDEEIPRLIARIKLDIIGEEVEQLLKRLSAKDLSKEDKNSLLATYMSKQEQKKELAERAGLFL